MPRGKSLAVMKVQDVLGGSMEGVLPYVVLL